jgi:TP901 family phage tail tape measure protein
MILDVKQALSAYTSARQAQIATTTALHTGAGAMIASGTAIAGVGAVMVGGLMAAVGAAAEFEKKLDYFAAVSNSTQKEYEAVSAKALQLGADTVYSANQVADSFIELGKSGISAKQIVDGVGAAVVYLGAAADLPLDTAANIITAAVATFGLSADQAIVVANKLAGAANASIVDVEDLGTSLKYAGGAAAAIGVPFEEVNTALALLGTYGIKGSTAGTSLRQILLQLSGTTPKATNALKDLGIITADGTNRFFDAAGSAKPLAEIFQILQDATAGLTDKQKVSVLNTIFQNRALAASLDLTKSGAAGFNEMAAAIDKTKAADVAGKRLDNLAGDIEVLRGNIDTMLVTAGTPFQNFFRGIVQGVTNVIQVFGSLPDGLQIGILSFIGIMGVLLIVIGTLGIFAGSVMNIIALSIQMGQAFGLLKGIMAAWKTALLATTAVQWLLNAAMAANPIGIIIVAIAAVVAALIWFFTQTDLGRKIWTNFVSFLSDAWNNIVSFATDTFTNLGNFFSDIWTNIVGFFKGAIDWIVNAFLNFTPQGLIISHWGEIVGFFSDLWNNIVSGISNFIGSVISFFQQLPQNILTFFQELPGKIGYFIGFLLGTITRIFLQIGQWLLTNVPLIINNVITFFANLPAQIGQFFTDIWNNLIAWGVSILLWAVTTIPQIIDNIVSFFVNLPGQIIQFFTDLYNGAVSWFTQLAINLTIGALNIYRGIVNWLQQLPQAIANFFIGIYNNVVKFFTDAYNKAIEIATNIYNGIKSGIEGIPKLVTQIFNNVVNAIKNVIKSAVKAVTDFASGLWEGFKDGLGIHSPSYIERAMWQITGVLADETDNMKKQVRTIQGLGNGITEIGDNLGNGFGSNLNSELISLQEQMASVRNLQAQVGLNATGDSGGVGANATALNNLDKTLAGLKPETNINVEINNPTAEPASTSLPGGIRKAVFIAG